MDRKVSELFNHQTVLSERHGIITLLIDGGSTGESALPAGARGPDVCRDRQVALLNRSRSDAENSRADRERASDGGPLIAIVPGQFDAKLDRLDEALGTLNAIKANTRLLPIANPLPGSTLTSPYGKRRDPILQRPAMHSGMDFRALSGAPVKAAGAGTVVAAGWNGGYSRMVDIDHGNGIVTRYAHMKKITVREGQKVRAGAIVGKVGSSGRPTGPHLHYEVRHRGRPVNPNRFLAVGRKLSKEL